MIQVQIITKGHQPLPAFATPQSAGMDLRANIDEAIVLHPMERRLVQMCIRDRYNICPTALHRSGFPDSVLLPSAYRQVPGNPA